MMETPSIKVMSSNPAIWVMKYQIKTARTISALGIYISHVWNEKR